MPLAQHLHGTQVHGEAAVHPPESGETRSGGLAGALALEPKVVPDSVSGKNILLTCPFIEPSVS